MNPEPNNWWIAGQALLILAATYGLSKLVKYLVTQLMDNSSSDEKIAALLGEEDSQAVKKWSNRAARLIVIFVGVFFTYETLIRIPAIAEFRERSNAFVVQMNEHSVAAFVINALFVLIVTILFLRVLNGFGRTVSNILQTLKSDRRHYIKAFTVRKLEIFSAKQMKTFILTGIRGLRWIIVILLWLAYLMILFAIFPTTRGIVVTVLTYVFEVLKEGWLGLIQFIPNLLSLVVIAVITRIVIRMSKYIFDRLKNEDIKIQGFDPEWADATSDLVRILLLALAIVIAFPYLPFAESPAFQGLSIFIGALLSLGSTSVVGNLMAGIVLIYTSAFNVGDRVKIAETFGDVIEKTMLVTRVRTIKNVEVTIPNSMVLASHIINYTEEANEKGLILNTTITLSYDVSWRKVHEVLIAAALATPGVDPDPKPFVYQTALDDFYVHYEINAYTCQPEVMDDTYSFLHENIQDKCNEAGIEITSPHYHALRDGNTKAVPAEHLPKGYQAPGFKINKGE